MSGDSEEMYNRLQVVIGKFRQKGATSPEKALSSQEIGLPPRFEQAMHRRLGQTGIFVEVNGKYYLNEERLKQIQQERGQGGDLSGQRSPGWLRYAAIILMLPISFTFITLLFLIFNLTGAGPHYPEDFLIILSLIILIVFVARMLIWRRYWQRIWQTG